MVDHNLLAGDIHEDNIKAGWWKQEEQEHYNMGTEPTYSLVTLPRNIGELICLMHSEISEAFEGHKLSLFDDHLPLHPMFNVELADAAIRIYDTLGYYGKPVDIYEVPWTFALAPINSILLEIHLRLDLAMEGFRKKDEEKGCNYLCSALRHIWSLAKREKIDLLTVINEKREYNRNRADHKLEARAAEGGKEF